MSQPRILAWDLENSLMTLQGWGLFNQNFGIDQIVEPSRVLCFGAKWLGEKKNYTFKSVHDHGRTEMLDTLHELLTEADAVVSWNGAGFDTKVANREFIIEGYTPPAPYVEVDLMRAVKRMARFPSNKLDWVSRELGIGTKVKHEGVKLWQAVQAGDEAAWKKFRQYQRQDVELLDGLYEYLLPWIPASMHPNVAIGKIGDYCTRCGSDDLESRGQRYHKTTAGWYASYRCRNCGSWPRGMKRLATSELRG